MFYYVQVPATAAGPARVLMDGGNQVVFVTKESAEAEAAACGCGAKAYPVPADPDILSLDYLAGANITFKGV